MISVNERAYKLIHKIEKDSEALGLALATLPNGSKVVDAGINVQGSLFAGKYYAEICMGGLGKVSFTSESYGDFWLPGVTVVTEQPVLACMAAQYAGWRIDLGDFFAMASGPARALALVEDLFTRLEYRDHSSVAVIALEGRRFPTVEVAEWIARKCRVAANNLWLVVSPTASLVGSVQISARVVETGMHKLMELGFDLKKVVSGFGTAPLAPVAADDLLAIGRTNDCVLYGGKVYYTVQAADREIEKVIEKLPSVASRDYGTPFYQVFQRYSGDFYKIDPLLFSPAEVVINNLSTGRVFRAGQVNREVLKLSLLGGGK